MKREEFQTTETIPMTYKSEPESTSLKARLMAPLDTPWKVWNTIHSWGCLPFVRFIFLWNGIAWGESWHFFGVPVIQKHRRSLIRFGSGLSLRSSLRSNPLGPNHPVFITTWQSDAVLTVGSHFAMTGGTLCAAERIEIGDHVTIGDNVTVVDSDFHPIDPVRRLTHPNDGQTSPVIIENNVFIGMNSLILKGVKIGEGSVIGAGSVVTKDVPPGVIVAGNPARVINGV